MNTRFTFAEIAEGLRRNEGLRDFFRNQQRFLHLFLLAVGCDVDRARLTELLKTMGRECTPQTYYRLRGELQADGWIEDASPVGDRPSDGRAEVPHRVKPGREQEFLRNLVETAASDRPVTISKYHLFELGLKLSRAPDEASGRDVLAAALAEYLSKAADSDEPTCYAREGRFVYYPHFVVQQMAERFAAPTSGVSDGTGASLEPAVADRVLVETLELLRSHPFSVEAGLSRRGKLAEVHVTSGPHGDGSKLELSCRARVPGPVDFSSIRVHATQAANGEVVSSLSRAFAADGNAELTLPGGGLYRLAARRYSTDTVPNPTRVKPRSTMKTKGPVARAVRTRGRRTPTHRVSATAQIDVAGGRVAVEVRDSQDGTVELVLQTSDRALAEAHITLVFFERDKERPVAEARCRLTAKEGDRWTGRWSSKGTELPERWELRLSRDP